MARTKVVAADKREQLPQILETAVVRITLGTLFLIPLIFPIGQTSHPFGELKTFVLHIGMSLVTILWLWQKVLLINREREMNPTAEGFKIFDWTGYSPMKWAVASLIVMLLAEVLSAALSPLPAISFFGVNENFGGSNVYDSFSLLVIFLVVAFKFRTTERLEQLAWVLIGSATIASAYGIAQNFGWDPLANRFESRVVSSFGNTINFSAYVGMAVPVTIAISLKKSLADRKYQLLFGLVLALLFAGIWFSASRGPIIGGAFGVATLFVGIALLRSKAELLRGILVTSIGVLGAVVIMFMPAPEAKSGSEGFAAVLSIGSQISDIGSIDTSSDAGGGLPGRIQNWRNTLKITQGWEVPKQESVLKRAARPLFGLGPEMYVYSYPLVGDPHTRQTFTAHPHNYPLLVLIGQGYVGFGLLISSTVLILFSVWISLRRLRSGAVKMRAVDWILIAFTAGLAGKIVESQVGVARVSDLAMTFALAGAVIAISETIGSRVKIDGPANEPSQRFVLSNRMMFQTVVAGALIATLAASWLAVSWDVRRLSASLAITFAERTDDGSIALEGLIAAQKRAPERRILTMQLADIYFINAIERSNEGKVDDARLSALAARELLVEFEKRDPYEGNNQISLAKTSSTLVEWGHAEFVDEMRYRYLRLADLFRQYPAIISTSATALVRTGDNELAIELADKAIAMEEQTNAWPAAWYAKGVALINLGETDEAIAALTTAIEKEPLGVSATQSHQALAFIYNQQGNTERSEFHSSAASP